MAPDCWQELIRNRTMMSKYCISFHDDKTNTIRVSIYNLSVLRALAAKDVATSIRGITFRVRMVTRGEERYFHAGASGLLRGRAALICARQLPSRATSARGNAAQGTSLPTEESTVLELLWTSRVVRGCAARICARPFTQFVLFWLRSCSGRRALGLSGFCQVHDTLMTQWAMWSHPISCSCY